MSEIKLKKCPFCGGEAEIISDAGYLTESEHSFVRCTECDVCGKWYGATEEAAEAWNRRADGWHKWPEEKPAEIGGHLIIYGSADCFDAILAYWDGKKWYQYTSYHAYRPERVLAWHELPEPWEGKRE